MMTDIKTFTCSDCGKSYERDELPLGWINIFKSTIGQWDWCCPTCAEKLRIEVGMPKSKEKAVD
jgi:hypothetical protein